jgi:hypothetical protein
MVANLLLDLAVENWGDAAGCVIVNNAAEPDDEYRESGAAWYRLHAYNFPSQRIAQIWVTIFELAFITGATMRWRDYHARLRSGR